MSHNNTGILQHPGKAYPTAEHKDVDIYTAVSVDDELDEVCTCAEPMPSDSVMDYARKAGIAVGGGTMLAVGLVMIPLPTPFGCVVAGAGMGVLGTEFPAAQRVLDKTRDQVVKVLEANCGDDDSDEVQDLFLVVPAQRNWQQGKKSLAWSFVKSAKRLGKKALPILKSMGTLAEKKGYVELCVSESDTVAHGDLPDLSPSLSLQSSNLS